MVVLIIGKHGGLRVLQTLPGPSPVQLLVGDLGSGLAMLMVGDAEVTPARADLGPVEFLLRRRCLSRCRNSIPVKVLSAAPERCGGYAPMRVDTDVGFQTLLDKVENPKRTRVRVAMRVRRVVRRRASKFRGRHQGRRAREKAQGKTVKRRVMTIMSSFQLGRFSRGMRLCSAHHADHPHLHSRIFPALGS